MKLVIGTGVDWKKQDGVIGLDIIPEFNPDIVRDILRGLPFADETFDEVEIHHVLEHVTGHLACKPTDNFDFVINEIYRVLKIGGIANFEMPYWKAEMAVESAGHVRFFNENSLVNFYSNPYGKEMHQSQFAQCIKAIVEDNVVKIKLEK
jgi:predicted SAM-dependent methyltransferase